MQSMKTVVHFKAGNYLAITESWIYSQIQHLKRYRPIVYAMGTENLDIYPTETIRNLNYKPGFGSMSNFFNKAWKNLFGYYPYFHSSLKKDRAHLVHAHFGPSGYYFLKLKHRFGLPLITTFYGYDLSLLPDQEPVWKERYRELFAQGDLFLVEGNYMKGSLEKLGCPGHKITVRQLGVDLSKLVFSSRTSKNDSKIRILIAASFREKKGLPFAVEAIGKVKQAHPEYDITVTILGDSGGGPEGETEKKKILAIIDEYELKPCVKMLGFQPHPVFLQEAPRHDLFISPSVHAANGDTEGGAPVAIIEASAMGLPVLSTTHCDIPEVIIEGESGYLVPERDVGALTEKLELLISRPDVREKMGQAGRRHIEENYNNILQIQKLEKIYDELIDSFGNS